MMIFGGRQPAREREYLFVDGGCLRASVKNICHEVFGDAGAYQPHIPSLARGGTFDKVFYYDAVPGKAYDEGHAAYESRVQPDHDRFEKIQSFDRVHVALGKLVGPSNRQKGVDVRLAVDMMTHAFRGNISKATLFAGDADFVPLIKSLVSEGLHVTLWHPPQANAELKGSADSTILFDFKRNHDCFTADGERSAFQITSSGGGVISPTVNGLSKIVSLGVHQFAGRWAENNLNIWQSRDGVTWLSKNFSAPGASLGRALVAFEEITAWGVAATGEQWIDAS